MASELLEEAAAVGPSHLMFRELLHSKKTVLI